MCVCVCVCVCVRLCVYICIQVVFVCIYYKSIAMKTNKSYFNLNNVITKYMHKMK